MYKLFFNTADGQIPVCVKINHYYKNKATGKLALVVDASFAIHERQKTVIIKDPVTDYVMIEDLVDFIFEYVEYNP